MLSANHPFFYYYTITKADTSSADVKNAYKADKAKTKKPLKFYPNKFYSFKAIGAGTEIVKPVAGDEKYETLYWSTSKTPTEHAKNRTWKIGSAKGVTNASTYTMYVFFQKYRFDGNGWIPGDIEYKSVFWL
ncbi:hypothetical protein [Blautia sp. 1033sp1_1033st1_G9_1033SCRN_220408]|uniref:hypothetical protein n=1 Tax=Blautia sp. 1033sp1_1033st1_G9_1033SCRN_220408 TaxID=3144490 RepID=UPI0034A20A6E